MIKTIYFLFIIIVFYLFVIRNNELELGTYTAYPNIYSYLPNIKAYISIVRHGERYPTKNVFNKIDKSIGITKTSDLTSKGYSDMRLYGHILKMNYPQIFNNPNRYSVYSTTVKRAIQSAEATLDGLDSKNYIINGPNIDSFLKINNFFLKQNVPGDVYSCQFAKILHKKCDYCNYSKICDVEREHDRLNYKSIILHHKKGEKCYIVLQQILNKCLLSSNPQGYLFFCHDSTLAPLFYYFKLLGSVDEFRNSVMLPFGARIEILIDYSNNISLYLNGHYMKKLNI